MSRLKTVYKEFLIAIIPVIVIALLARLATGTFGWSEMFAGKSQLEGLILSRSADIVTVPGENHNFSVEFENRSDRSWQREGADAVYLLLERNVSSPFYVDNSTWLTESTISLFENAIAPGEIGHFNFTIGTDLDPGSYTQKFRLVDSDLKELQGVKPIQWQIDIEEPEWGFELVSQSDNISVARGQTATLEVRYKNTGNTTWHNYGEHPVKLAVGGENETQFYIDPRWSDEWHPAFLDEASVSPGEEGTFTFDIKALESLGTIRAQFVPEVFGLDGLDLPPVEFDITVAENPEGQANELPSQERQIADEDYLRMTAVPVGHGDCYILVTPEEEVIVFDTGHPDRANVVVNALQEIGVDKIDYLILSHSHWDHIGGAPYIMDAYPVDNIYINGEGYPYETYSRLAQYFTDDGSNVDVVAFGDKINVSPEITISIYNPAEKLSEINENDEEVNNNSLVARVTWGDRAILLTSDIYTESIEKLVNADIDLSADILTLPHHGNDGFGEVERVFLEEIMPSVAIKSSDWGELQTQTSGDMLDYLHEINAEFVATARDGKLVSQMLPDQLIIGSDSLIWRR